MLVYDYDYAYVYVLLPMLMFLSVFMPGSPRINDISLVMFLVVCHHAVGSVFVYCHNCILVNEHKWGLLTN